MSSRGTPGTPVIEETVGRRLYERIGRVSLLIEVVPRRFALKQTVGLRLFEGEFFI